MINPFPLIIGTVIVALMQVIFEHKHLLPQVGCWLKHRFHAFFISRITLTTRRILTSVSRHL